MFPVVVTLILFLIEFFTQINTYMRLSKVQDDIWCDVFFVICHFYVHTVSELIFMDAFKIFSMSFRWWKENIVLQLVKWILVDDDFDFF